MIDKIKCMLEFLAEDRTVRERKKGVYELESHIHLDIPEYKKRDIHSVSIDTNKEVVFWYSAYESDHNGDHYDCKHGTVPLDSVYDQIVAMALAKIKRDVIVEAAQEVKRAEQEMAEKNCIRSCLDTH